MSRKGNSVDEDYQPHEKAVKKELIFDYSKVVVKKEPMFDMPVPVAVPMPVVVKEERVFDNRRENEVVRKEPILGVVREEPILGAVKKEPILGAVKKEPILGAVKKEPILGVVKKEKVLDVVKKAPIGNEQYNNKRLLNVKKRHRGASGEKRVSKRNTMKSRCDECGTKCISLSMIRQHQCFHMNDCPYKCLICKKGFFSVLSFVDHDRLHIGNRPFTCEECRTVLYYLRLQLQGKNETTEKSLQFEVERGFVCYCAFKPYDGKRLRGKVICEVCEKAYSYSGEYARLSEKHSFQCMLAKPFKCDMCGMGFETYSSLMQHKWNHEETKPWVN